MADKNTSIDDRLRAELKSLRSSISTPQVVSGIVVFLIFLCFMPFMLILLPVAIIILVTLFWIGRKTEGEAERLASKKRGSSISRLHIVENTGLADTLVLNDWGIVLTSPGKQSKELCWDELTSVEEPQIGNLVFRSTNGEFLVDLNEHNYLLLTDAITSMIPGRTDFDICFDSGKSLLLEKLSRQPLKWTHRNQYFSITTTGVEFNHKIMNWTEILSVYEHETTFEDAGSNFSWIFKSAGSEFLVTDDLIQSKYEVSGLGGEEKLKAIAAEKIPDRVQFGPCRAPATASNRAWSEFRRNQEACKPAFAYALQHEGNFKTAIEPMFRHMLKIVEKFSFEDRNDAQKFFMHYSELLKRTNRPREAADMLARVKTKD